MFEAVLAVLAIWWLWPLVVAHTIFVMGALEFEKPWASTLVTALTIGMVCFIYKFSPLPWIIGHPLLTIGLVVGWFLAGTAWAVAKWGFFCADLVERYGRARNRFFEQYGGKAIPKAGEDKASYWFNILREELGSRYTNARIAEVIPPDVAKNKGRILTWMSWWPWSLVWTIINDPVRKIFTRIYYAIGRYLQNISDALFKKYQGDFDPKL